MENVILQFLAIISLLSKGLIPWKSKKKKDNNILGEWISFRVLYSMFYLMQDDGFRENRGKNVHNAMTSELSSKRNLDLMKCISERMVICLQVLHEFFLNFEIEYVAAWEKLKKIFSIELFTDFVNLELYYNSLRENVSFFLAGSPPQSWL